MILSIDTFGEGLEERREGGMVFVRFVCKCGLLCGAFVNFRKFKEFLDAVGINDRRRKCCKCGGYMSRCTVCFLREEIKGREINDTRSKIL